MGVDYCRGKGESLLVDPPTGNVSLTFSLVTKKGKWKRGTNREHLLYVQSVLARGGAFKRGKEEKTPSSLQTFMAEQWGEKHCKVCYGMERCLGTRRRKRPARASPPERTAVASDENTPHRQTKEPCDHSTKEV